MTTSHLLSGPPERAERAPDTTSSPAPLYTPEQRARRDATVWTLVQGILAPVQFIVFLVSLGLVIGVLVTGEGVALATASVVLKTLVLYAIMVTGAIWEKVVFGRYLFAPAFFWEDVVSVGVLVLHTAYLVMVFAGLGTATEQLWLALAAYAAYVINAAQFVWKLRCARLQAHASASPSRSGPDTPFGIGRPQLAAPTREVTL